MGCLAILKDVTLSGDFILEVEAWHDDDDASGLIFGYQDDMNFYESMMFNDDWLDSPSDGVLGPFLKVGKRNGKECLVEMNATTSCYDMLAYISRPEDQLAADYPNGRLTSMEYVPAPYASEYVDFRLENSNNLPVRQTVIVSDGQIRTWYRAKTGAIVAAWADLPADYAGGRIGLKTSAHQANFRSIKIVDLSNGPNAVCKDSAATCDTTLGICTGGATVAPTDGPPTAAPTFVEICPDPPVAPAAGYCPAPVGGAQTSYDVTDITAWELLDQAPISEPCAWSADASGLRQSSNAWGNFPSDQTLIGCIALIPDTYAGDVIVEFEAVHDDNDAFGIVFGYSSPTDHWIGTTLNDVWPTQALDSVTGPHTKLRKTTGTACTATMTAATNCYETLGYTDAKGFSYDGVTTYDMPRSKEYEYTHAYAADLAFQPTKLTLIIQGQEARLLYASPGINTGEALNAVRQTSRYQSAQTYDLKGYAGGRIGLMTYAHQFTVTSFTVTDLSDATNLPTAYCGDASTFCDSGFTGLCLGVAARDVCEKAVGPTVFDMTYIEQFEYIDDATLEDPCVWERSVNGLIRQSSNAFRYDGVLLGCNALLNQAPEYTDFLLEMWWDNQDNDAVGVLFGWKADDDYFRITKHNSNWNIDPPSDGVYPEFFKIEKRVPGTTCEGYQGNVSNPCYTTIAFVDRWGSFVQNMPSEAIVPAGECGYSNVYQDFDEADRSKIYLIVKENQVRATYESPDTRRQVTVQAFDLTPWNYQGGRVGIFMYVVFWKFGNFLIFFDFF